MELGRGESREQDEGAEQRDTLRPRWNPNDRDGIWAGLPGIEDIDDDDEGAADSEVSVDPDWEPQDEPERPYRGGRYKDLPREPGRERHHLIAAASLKEAGMNPAEGLAITMERADHLKTGSHGNSTRARQFRAEQTRLVLSGHASEALAMGVLDVSVNVGPKYEAALEEAIDAAER